MNCQANSGKRMFAFAFFICYNKKIKQKRSKAGGKVKIIHCADVHLDSKMEINLTKEQAKQRKQELLLTFCAMVDYAVAHEVHVIIIAGDLFDTNRSSIRTQNIVWEVIVNHPEIDFLYIRGNHDKEKRNMASGPNEDRFLKDREIVPQNLKLFGMDWRTYNYGNIAITGVELCAENNRSIYDTLYLEQGMINIVVLHGQESNYYSGEQTEIVNLRELKGKNIDYLALGHLHSYKMQELDKRGVYCYSGCLEGRGFDECGLKGFVLLDSGDEVCSNDLTVKAHTILQEQFIPFGKRTFHEIVIDVTGLFTSKEVEDAIELKVAGIASKDLVKVIMIGSVELDTSRDIEYLARKFSQHFFYFKIYDRTKLAINIEDYQNDISLKGEFIRTVLSTKLPEDKKTRIIINGIKALSGEDII
jgi:DNA repair protein SbcD/Mre11